MQTAVATCDPLSVFTREMESGFSDGEEKSMIRGKAP